MGLIIVLSDEKFFIAEYYGKFALVNSKGASVKKPLVIAISCHKGGVGKTSSTVGIADALAVANPGKRILIVDADEQSNVKTIFGIKLSGTEGGLATILLENASPNHVKVNVRPQIDVILSGGRRMREFERTHQNTPNAELMMKLRFTDDVSNYDFVLIDSPPALSLISSNIVTYADWVVIPSSPDLLSLVGVKNTVYFVENMQMVLQKQGIPVAGILGILPTMFDARRNVDITMVDDLERMADRGMAAGGVVFTPIRTDIKVKTAQIKRKLLSEAFPNSKSAEDFRTVANEIMEQVRIRGNRTDLNIPGPNSEAFLASQMPEMNS